MKHNVLYIENKSNFKVMLVSFCMFLFPKFELTFFLILAQPVYKMWIIQEPNTLELLNKLHLKKEKTQSICNV